MLRENMLSQLEAKPDEWDVVIIGGGASGIGAAIESVTRGLKTLLLEQHDFSKGTSSRSTKLVHGGVRYLAQGNIALVLEALRERGKLKKNAPHLVKNQSFIIPNYKWWGVPFYTIGLMLYDFLSGKLTLGASRPFSRNKTLLKIPTLIKDNLYGGVIYHDGQFDDSRLAVNMVQTFVENGGVALNYMKVTNLIKPNGKVTGVETLDVESNKKHLIKAKSVLNATGVFVDHILKMDNPGARDIVRPSQGVHLVIDKKFVPGDYAIMIPKTSDGRVFFAVPWHNKVVLGTTDIMKDEIELEPKALDQEIDFILETATRFLKIPPQRSDVRSVFAGLRPLAAPQKNKVKTKEISRGHIIKISESGLITITGGKWTTYRQMAEDVINCIAKEHDLTIKESNTDNYKIHGFTEHTDMSDPLYFYGSDKNELLKLKDENSTFGEYLSNDLNIIKAQVIWGVRKEMARTVEDILSRRTRALLLDAKQSIEMAPEVARLMADELGKDETWQKQQVAAYTELAQNYMLQ